jgi:hypothetical protein
MHGNVAIDAWLDEFCKYYYQHFLPFIPEIDSGDLGDKDLPKLQSVTTFDAISRL